MCAGKFDPVRYKESTRQEWQAHGKGWNGWASFLQQWLGPATGKMFDMARISVGNRVLDVAAGAGNQTLQIAERVGPNGYVLATDLSSNILELAKINARNAGYTNVEAQVLDGENLELPESSFDAIVCRLGLMIFPNREKAVQGFHRVLNKNGNLGLIVFTTPENNEFLSLPFSIARNHAKLPPPSLDQPGAFSLGNPKILEQLLDRSGFKNIQENRVKAPLRMKSVDELVRFEREAFPSFQTIMSRLTENDKEQVWREIRTTLSKFETTNGVSAPCELLVTTATKQ